MVGGGMLEGSPLLKVSGGAELGGGTVWSRSCGGLCRGSVGLFVN